MTPTSGTAFYNVGGGAEAGSVVQMKGAGAGANFFPSAATMLRYFALGGPGDQGDASNVGNRSIDILLVDGSDDDNRTSVLLSSDSGEPYWSGLQQVLAGPPSLFSEEGAMDTWMVGWQDVTSATLTAGATSWDDTFVIGVNDRDFPVATLTGGANLPLEDLHATVMGIYGSPAGCLCTHPNEVATGETVGQIATTIARPDRGYR
jgi:hypothetical protein